MIYRLLGDLETGAEGSQAELPGGPTLAVLTALLVNANRRVPKAALIRVAWGDDEVGEAQLPKRIGMVREHLAKIGRREDLRTHAGFGYELRVTVEDLDMLLFQQRLRQAEEAASQHRTDDEISCLRDALRLWRGPHPLSNVPGDAFRHQTVSLEHRHKRAAARLYDLELARGNHSYILDELILSASYYPADGRLCEQLMIAAYRCGHVADVTQAYERHETTLGEELGSKPDKPLRDLHFAMARGDDEAISAAQDAITKRAGASTPADTKAVPAQLPRPEALVGRDDLIAEVTWLLRREPNPAVPVIIISGPGGIGKTALAVRAAHESRDRYPDGQLYLDLGSATAGGVDTSEVVAQFLRSLGAAKVPETKAERLAEYRTMLANRRVLILLDDVADGSQVSELAPASSGCAVLVTARQRLPEVSGAHHVAPLEPLAAGCAAELFVRVVSDAGITFDDDLSAVDRVVELCGGLPLALRIAGAMRVHDNPRSTFELADRLEAQGTRAFAYGRLSVARTIGAGYERLDFAARQLFLGLGLLPLPGFGLWTAAALLEATGADGAAAVSQLASSFMIDSVEAGRRYRFHDLSREYARQRAIGEYPADRDLVPVQVYRALLTLARRAHASLYGGDFEVVHSSVRDWDAPAQALAEVDIDPIAWFERERLNLRIAVDHCASLGLVELCWDLAVSAHEFYGIKGYFDDWHATHTSALEACRRAGDSRGQGIVLACLNQPALVASRRTDSARALIELRQAVSLLTDDRDRHSRAITMRTLAHALRRQGHLTEPLALLKEALLDYAACADQVGQSQTLRFIGQTYLDLGEHEQARQALTAAESVARELRSERLIAQTRYWTGQACLATGDIAGAQAAFESVLKDYQDPTGVGPAYAVHGLGDVAWRTGAYSVAEQRFAEAIDLAHEGQDAGIEGRIWLSMAGMRQAQGNRDGQEAALKQAVTVFAVGGAARLQARALALLAQALSDRGDETGAQATWARIEDLYQSLDVPRADRIHPPRPRSHAIP